MSSFPVFIRLKPQFSIHEIPCQDGISRMLQTTGMIVFKYQLTDVLVFHSEDDLRGKTDVERIGERDK